MMTRTYFFRWMTMGIALLFLASCGQGTGGGDSKNGLGTALQAYQAQPVSFTLSGEFPGQGALKVILLKDDQQELVGSFTTEDEKLDISLQDIPGNEVYYLQIKGKAQGYGDNDVEWIEWLPVLAQQGAALTLVAKPHDTFDSLSKLRFSIQGGGDDQDFLQEWYYAVLDKREQLDNQSTKHIDLSSGTQQSTGLTGKQYEQELKNVSKGYIAQAKPLVSTLYLISRENDHRSKIELYRSIFEKTAIEAQTSKYGVDLNNRIVKITEPVPPVDFDQFLAARTSQLLPFDPKAFADNKYLLLVFWSSRTQANNGFDVSGVEGLVAAEKPAGMAILYFSLDTKMSEWKPVTDKLKLDNSYMLRAEVRQAAIDHFYLSELPRFMILKPDGTVIENDVPLESLPETLGNLE